MWAFGRSDAQTSNFSSHQRSILGALRTSTEKEFFLLRYSLGKFPKAAFLSQIRQKRA